MKTLILAFSLVVASAQASVISRETGEIDLNRIEDLAAKCRPGVAPNGHNFPTSSGIALHNLDTILPLTNTRAIGMLDPKGRLGNFCAELTREINATLPAKLILTRTVSEGTAWINGVCAKTLTEELVATLGSLRFFGNSGFVVNEQSGQCR